MMLVESLASRDGVLENLVYHNRRFNEARKKLFGALDYIDLADIVRPQKEGLLKCRVLYNTAVHDVTYEVYTRRTITSLRLVESESIEYAYKFADRRALEALFARRNGADDVLIVKNGLITDSYAANIAAYDGKHWYTPAVPLLQGTRRQALLDARLIIPRDISVEDLAQYKTVSIINCMIGLGELKIPVGKIYT